LKGTSLVIGCLLVGVLIILLFVLVPFQFWPLLVVGLVLLLIVASVLGVVQRIAGALFGRR
jgi:hypothetical protein